MANKRSVVNFFYWLFGLVLLFVIIWTVYFFSQQRTQNNLASVLIQQGTFVREVAVAGRFISQQELILSSEVSGLIKEVRHQVGDAVSVGDVLFVVDTREIDQQISAEQARLRAAQAQTISAESVLEAEKVALQQLQNDNQNQSSNVQIAERQLTQEIRRAYEVVDDSIKNSANQIFRNPETYSVQLIYTWNGSNVAELKTRIERQRRDIQIILDTWQRFLSRSTDEQIRDSIDTVFQYLETVRIFFNDLATVANQFVSGEDLPQTTLVQYRSDISVARSTISALVLSLHNADDATQFVQTDFSAQSAKTRAAESSVETAKANAETIKSNIALLQVQRGRTTITTPVSGIIFRQDLRVGQQVLAGSEVSAIMSPQLGIEAFIPELNIINVAVGNRVEFTLDADGNEKIRSAVVNQIDPAQTIHDGVATYRVLFNLIETGEDNSGFRSGMTVNLRIKTSERGGMVLLPSRSIGERNGEYFVRVVTLGINGRRQISERNVLIGERDSFGNTIIISGLRLGEEVLLDF